MFRRSNAFGNVGESRHSRRLQVESLEDRWLLAFDAVLFADLNSEDVNPSQFVVVGDDLYFTADGLWKSDGTEPGTVLIHEELPASLTELNGSLFFSLDKKLWTSDGTTTGDGSDSRIL